MMDTCCQMCCPHPGMSVIRPQGMAGRCRTYVKYIMITEVVVCILHMMIFDIMSGFTHSISIWIDFMAFSTMGFCQAMILIFAGGLDLGMMLFSWFRSDTYQTVINSHWFSRTGFWFIIVFYIVKLVVACITYAVWKNEFKK